MFKSKYEVLKYRKESLIKEIKEIFKMENKLFGSVLRETRHRYIIQMENHNHEVALHYPEASELYLCTSLPHIPS